MKISELKLLVEEYYKTIAATPKTWSEWYNSTNRHVMADLIYAQACKLQENGDRDLSFDEKVELFLSRPSTQLDGVFLQKLRALVLPSHSVSQTALLKALLRHHLVREDVYQVLLEAPDEDYLDKYSIITGIEPRFLTPETLKFVSGNFFPGDIDNYIEVINLLGVNDLLTASMLRSVYFEASRITDMPKWVESFLKIISYLKVLNIFNEENILVLGQSVSFATLERSLKKLMDEGILDDFTMKYTKYLSYDGFADAVIVLNDKVLLSESILSFLACSKDYKKAAELFSILNDAKVLSKDDTEILDNTTKKNIKTCDKLIQVFTHIQNALPPSRERCMTIASHPDLPRAARLIEKLSNGRGKDGFTLLTEETFNLAVSYDPKVGYAVEKLVSENRGNAVSNVVALQTAGLYAGVKHNPVNELPVQEVKKHCTRARRKQG